MPSTIGTDTVTSIARRYIMPQIIEAVYDSNALWFRLNKAAKKQVQGGYQIELPVQYGKPQQTQAYTGYDVINVAPFDVIKNAKWDWKQYATTVAIDGLTLIKVDSPESIANLITTQFDLAKRDFVNSLGADLYAGSSTDAKKMEGLRDGIKDSGSYGGLNSASTFWKSKIDSSTALGSVTPKLMNDVFSALTIGREHPTLIVGRRAFYNKFWELIYGTAGPTAAYPIAVPATGSDEILAQAGFTNLLFNNVPIVQDEQVDAGSGSNGRAYFLNENWWNIVVSPRADMAVEDFQTPINQDAMVAKVLWAGNTICSNPRLQGAFTAL
jgi:hypothetical protein